MFLGIINIDITAEKLIDCLHFSNALLSRAQLITMATNKEVKGQQPRK